MKTASEARMRPSDALDYARRFGFRIIPVTEGERRKPYIRGWQEQATAVDTERIIGWWRQWPHALPGAVTGHGIIVLDIDTKRPEANGYDTLEILGRAILPETPMAHTRHAGLHVYFSGTDTGIRNSQGKDGLGPGLDVRGHGGFITLPSEGSGYCWDPHYNLDTVPLLPAPAWLGHRQSAHGPKSTRYSGLNPDAILAAACENIRHAQPGDRHEILNREAFGIARLVRSGALDEREARHQLESATAAMTWSSAGDRHKAARDLADAFRDGLARGRK